MKKFVLTFSLTTLDLRSGTPENPALDVVQDYLIGVIASAVVYVLKLITARWPQVTIKRDWLTVLLYLIA